MPFEIGHQKKGGRKQGIPNKSTKQIRELLTSIFNLAKNNPIPNPKCYVYDVK